MMNDIFLKLVRLGLGISGDVTISNGVDWIAMHELAVKQGLTAVVLDGIEGLPEHRRPTRKYLLHWIGEVLRGESMYSLQHDVAKDVAKLFYRNHIRTYVLKTTVVSECYPKPNHRVSADIDCYLLPERGAFDAWERGNELIRRKGFVVNKDFSGNSSFDISGVVFENHRHLTPFRGNERLAAFEKWLQEQFRDGTKELRGSRMGETWLYRPPVLATALFLIEHAYSHFLHEGLTWRQVLDWMMFCRKHQEEIDWTAFEALTDEFGFRRFYDSYNRLGQYLIGEIQDSGLTAQDRRMLDDVWAELDVHESVQGIMGKIRLVCSTWRARWKYRYFSEDSIWKCYIIGA